MLREDILRTLGGMAILVAAMAWLSKALLLALLSKDLERFKSDLQVSAQKSVESFKASLRREAQRIAVGFTALHSKRAELIADLYARIVNLYAGILSLSRELGAREVGVEQYRKHEAGRNKPWEIKAGIHTPSPTEEAKANVLHETYKDFARFYNEKKIYFSDDVCSLIDSFATLAGYMGVMYQNVALRDDDDQPYVNPLLLRTWEKAAEKVPALLAAVEKESQAILEVS